MDKIEIVRLGDFFIPDINDSLKYLFNGITDLEFGNHIIEIGAADYIIGDFIEEHSMNKLIDLIDKGKTLQNSYCFGIINECIEKNYFSQLVRESKLSVISINKLEDFDINLEHYLILSILEHYMIHKNPKLGWHYESKRCIFDYCADKKDIKISSQYLGLCEDCSHSLGLQDKTLLQRIKQIINGNMEIEKILFISANSKGSTLRLDTEMRDVELQIKKISKKRKDFDLCKTLATRIIDLQQELLDFQPTIVHFSGHGNQQGIILNDTEGNPEIVKTEPLANLFNLFSDKISCVFLNSCYSEVQAKVISQYIPYVVGMSTAVPDNVAIQFSTSFYQSISSGKDIEFSFDFAKNSIALNNLKGDEIPILIKNASH